ncbi:MAG: ribonuclease III [Clostridia bacterium]|nr:ribonuclease III [Clostridia bacterium]
MRLFPMPVDTRDLSPITLAFVGDGVYELMVREHLAAEANRPTGVLHKMAVSRVCAGAQAAAFSKIEPLLTEEEMAVFKRGRNAHTARGGQDYHRATGFEALWGWLYLNDRDDRLRELFAVITAPDTP